MNCCAFCFQLILRDEKPVEYSPSAMHDNKPLLYHLDCFGQYQTQVLNPMMERRA